MTQTLLNQILFAINTTSAVLIFIHAVCRLSGRKWRLNQPELWIYGALSGGAVGIVCHEWLTLQAHHPTEISLNAALAAYFTLQSWRILKIRRKGHWKKTV